MTNKKELEDAIKELLGQELTFARIDAGLNQQEAGLRSGYDFSNLNKIERGTRMPNMVTILKLMKVYNLNRPIIANLIKRLEEEGIPLTFDDREKEGVD